MVDFARSEELLGIEDIRHIAPRTRRGPISGEAIRQWTIRGVAGVKLEHEWLGGRIVTSRAALERFLAEVNRVKHRTPSPAVAAGPGVRCVSRAEGL